MNVGLVVYDEKHWNFKLSRIGKLLHTRISEIRLSHNAYRKEKLLIIQDGHGVERIAATIRQNTLQLVFLICSSNLCKFSIIESLSLIYTLLSCHLEEATSYVSIYSW